MQYRPSPAIKLDPVERNVQAFLYALRQAEGTQAAADPYRVCYAYKHTIVSLADHPSITGEWKGERLPDEMCLNAGYKPGCVSTAAGAYQLVRATWRDLRDKLDLDDFGPASQDAAALELVRQRGALTDVKAGSFSTAFVKCRFIWASLPGNYARQPQRATEQLAKWVREAGATFA